MEEEKKSDDLASLIGMETPLAPRAPIQFDPTEDDFEFVRNNIKMAIEKGNTALDELLEMVIQSGHPRAAEVFSNHMKNLVEANRQLIETKRSDQQIKIIEVRGNKPDVLNQNVFVGSTAELAKMLDAKSK